MNEKDWVGEAKSRISVLLQCVSLEHILQFQITYVTRVDVTTTSISPDPIVVPKQNSYHIKPDSEGTCRPKIKKI
jgi:hypothetical protein